MIHTALTQREMSSDVIYKQNGLDVSAAVLYGITADLESERFHDIKAFNKKTGECRGVVYVNARTVK